MSQIIRKFSHCNLNDTFIISVPVPVQFNCAIITFKILNQTAVELNA